MLKWEKLATDAKGLALYRSKVPGGWLLWAHYGKAPGSLTFYPDPKHKWDGSSAK